MNGNDDLRWPEEPHMERIREKMFNRSDIIVNFVVAALVLASIIIYVLARLYGW